MKIALHVRGPASVIQSVELVPAAIQSPVHPPKLYPVSGVTNIPRLIDPFTDTVHRSELPALQCRPAPCTVPPAGTGKIVIVYGGPFTGPPVDVNTALQLFAALTSTDVVALVPLHDPPQLVKTYPEAGVAVSVAFVSPPNETWHVVPPFPHARPLPLTDPPAGTGAIVSA